uniref:CSON006552 protein n=1 Tax=Culicoides sonorensis TaxID=179676 RepID=A0A336MSS8_CULSO
MKTRNKFIKMLVLSFQCGMRRPSLGYTGDDLSRLTSGSSAAESTNSINTSKKPFTSNNKNNENGNHIIVSSYLTNIINNGGTEEICKNGRKRKERQDSTSSSVQDRKLVRSNSEEQLPNLIETDSFRRVSSHEDFNKKPPPLVFHNNENIISEEVTNNKLNEIKVKKEVNNKENGVQLKVHKHELRLSPHRDTKVHAKRHDHHDEEEHERRRSNERFCRARVSGTRKSASPRKSAKAYSPVMPTRYHHTELQQKMPFGGRGFGEDDDKIIEKKIPISKIEDAVTKDPATQLDKIDDSTPIVFVPFVASVPKSEKQNSQTPKPWQISGDDDTDMPVVCQRFANNTFSHVNSDTTKAFAKFHHHHHAPPTTTPATDTETCHIATKYKLVKEEKETEIMPNIFLTPDERIKQINKRLASLKKKITVFEENFERENGYRPSHADKQNDRIVKHATMEIQKLRKEKAQIRSDPMAAMGYRTTSDAGVSKENKLDKMKETLKEIQKRLSEKRAEENREENLDDLTIEQLNEEKIAIQRGLLYLESLFGRPNSREERDAARPLYDRYRIIKRMVNRTALLSSIGGGELPTILENEALALTTGGLMTPSNEDTSPPTDVQSPPSESSTSISGPEMSDANSNDTTDDAIGTINETIKLMSIDKLWIQLDLVREEKKQLRRSLKEFEYKFEEMNGRKMLKTDRKAMEETYALYKQKKAKLRLLDALVKKQMQN